MAPDDRDRTFEKALARHLRPSASSRPDGGGLAGASADLCPDPEMLAAYHDGSLSLDERNFWKQHVLGCDRCQFVLAHLETPLEIPVLTETNEKVAALQPAAPVSQTVTPARTPRPSLIHSLRWLWLVPAGAIAATLIAWVSLQDRKPLQTSPSAPVEVAENRPSSVPAPSPKPQIPARDDLKEADKDQLRAESPAAVDSANRDLAAKAPRNEVQLNQQAPLQFSPKVNHGPSVSAQKQEQQIGRIDAGNAGAAADLKKLDAEERAKPAPSIVGGQRALSLPPAPPPPVEPSFLADGSVSDLRKDKAPPVAAPAPASTSSAKAAAAKTKAASADAISAINESVEVSAAPTASGALLNERGKMRVASLQNPRVFWAPGEKQAWRIGPAGSLEHSKDKGVTWTPQISGVYTDLLAGSAPSAKVGWIVGAAGTILRTTDGGTHWTKLDSPVTNDLTGVRADDAKHVWIWFVPDVQTGVVKTYQSSDGGLTWSSAPSD